jgi:hypothetical protein
MSFFVRIKGCVKLLYGDLSTKSAYSCAESFCHWERFLKTTALLSNLIPPCFYYLTNLVRFSVWCLNPGHVHYFCTWIAHVHLISCYSSSDRTLWNSLHKQLHQRFACVIVWCLCLNIPRSKGSESNAEDHSTYLGSHFLDLVLYTVKNRT